MTHTTHILLSAALDFVLGPMIRLVKCVTIYRPLALNFCHEWRSDLFGAALRVLLVLSWFVALPGLLVAVVQVLMGLSLLRALVDVSITLWSARAGGAA